MTAVRIDGKAYAQGLRDRVKTVVTKLKTDHDLTPGLAVVLVGHDPASEVYVASKHKACEEAGIASFQHYLAEDTPQDELLTLIDQLNNDPKVHGILVQVPLPDQISEDEVIAAINPDKDVDGFHLQNRGRLTVGIPAPYPCTPVGCVLLAKDALGDDLSGKEVVVIGRSNIVGKPVAQLFIHENCTVTVAHSKTKDLPEVCRRADILVPAIGVPHFVKADWIKPGACVIDVGVNRIPAPEKGDNKVVIRGDVEKAAKEVAGFMTPVPGGVGPMTIACLLRGTVLAACAQHAVPVPDGLDG